MKGVFYILVVVIIAVLIENVKCAPVDPKKSTEKPSDVNEVEDAGRVSSIFCYKLHFIANFITCQNKTACMKCANE